MEERVAKLKSSVALLKAQAVAMKASAESILVGVGELEASLEAPPKAGEGGGAEGGAPLKRKRVMKPKDPNAPKRPITDFFLYCEKLRKEAPAGTKLKTKELSASWAVLPPGEKDAYIRKSQSLKEKYNAEKAKYEAGKAASSAASAAASAAAEEGDDSDDDDEDEDEEEDEEEDSKPPAKRPAKAVPKEDSDSDSDDDSDTDDEEAPAPVKSVFKSAVPPPAKPAATLATMAKPSAPPPAQEKKEKKEKKDKKEKKESK